MDSSAGTTADVDALRRTGHFVYESGHHGDTWLDLDRLFVNQRRLSSLAEDLASRLRPHGAEVVCGPLVGGALLGQWVASHLDLPFVLAERTPPRASEPARYRIPGAMTELVRGRSVAIVDDAINAGAATLAAASEIRRLGGTPTVAGAIFVRSPGGPELLRAHGLALEYLGGVSFAIWEPTDCPLCREGVPLVATT